MQPNMQLIRRIARKEITLSFSSPIAYIFLAVFAGATLAVFFWGESFFSRNIADVRPLFESMPVLLILLTSAITMRLWSEERRTGTLEHVLTQPVSLWVFVLGKFCGCLVLLLIALLITLPLPITVSIIGNLDWGPVIAGYIATILLGASYLSIGLFVSALCRNQVVSLICSVVLCGLLYLIGAKVITDLVGIDTSEILRLFATGARFDSITRGVIDIRDLYYYLSVIAVFLTLNTYVLERERWATSETTAHHRTWNAVTLLLLANVIGGNLWLGQINALRVDVTAGNIYSISDATDGYLNQLQEPLLMRGYFSSKTHPLLAPLVPQLRDLMREYEIAGDGKVRVEFVDPQSNPELEEEANQKYAIQPVPFQVADRYQASIVSSYFNVLVQYGDQHEVLGFRELIEIKASNESNIDVQLRNPEYDLTRAIRSVINSYQAGGNLFDTVEGELAFNAYVSADAALPQQLVDFKTTVQEVLKDYKDQAGDRLDINFVEPEANNNEVAQQIEQQYGFGPMATSLFSNDHFYFYLTLQRGDQIIQIPLDDASRDSFERNFEAGIKRFASGFTKKVALVTPEQDPQMAQFGIRGATYNNLQGFLGQELNVQNEDLGDGSVTGDADILILAGVKDLDEKALFAVDQFLMQGGTVIAATSPYSAMFNRQNLAIQPVDTGLSEWLTHYGITIEQQLVLDPQNAAFPMPVTRNIGGLRFQDVRMVDYPYLIDVRDDGINQDTIVTGDIPQATFAWASPIVVDQEKQSGREIIELFHSSPLSWLSESTDIMPRFDEGGISPFTPEGERGSQLLGVVSTGKFTSFFADKQSPLLSQEQEAVDLDATEEDAEADKDFAVSSVIKQSPESARLIVLSSNDFLRDDVIAMAGSATGSDYLNTLQFMANAVDWSLEDTGLLSIRARGHFNRTLPPMQQETQVFWEYLNYFLAALALVVIGFIQRQRRLTRQQRYQRLLLTH